LTTKKDLFRWSTNQVSTINTTDWAKQKIDTSYLFGQGLSNTNKILAAYPAAKFPNTAAAVASAYNGGGYKDWFLPSRNELYKLSLSNLSKKSINGDFYWSSSQSDDHYGVLLLFGGPRMVSEDKYFLARVIAIRSF